MKNYTSSVPVEITVMRIDRLGRRGASREQLIKNLGTGMLGKKHSEETKRKISAAHRGKPLSAATRANMSRARKGTQMGPDHPNWKGGQWADADGRVYVYRPDHPRANHKGYILRAHLVMESIIGRYVLPGEVVHHRNEDPSDDNRKNLRLFPSKGAHIAFHNTGKNRKGQGRKMLTAGEKEPK